jgi:hypothetical protein
MNSWRQGQKLSYWLNGYDGEITPALSGNAERTTKK